MATVGQAIEFGVSYWYLHWIYIEFYWYLHWFTVCGKIWVFPIRETLAVSEHLKGIEICWRGIVFANVTVSTNWVAEKRPEIHYVGVSFVRDYAHPGLLIAQIIGTPTPYPRPELRGYFIYSSDNDLAKSMWWWVMLGQYFVGFLLEDEHLIHLQASNTRMVSLMQCFSPQFPMFDMAISTRSPQNLPPKPGPRLLTNARRELLWATSAWKVGEGGRDSVVARKKSNWNGQEMCWDHGRPANVRSVSMELRGFLCLLQLFLKAGSNTRFAPSFSCPHHGPSCSCVRLGGCRLPPEQHGLRASSGEPSTCHGHRSHGSGSWCHGCWRTTECGSLRLQGYLWQPTPGIM